MTADRGNHTRTPLFFPDAEVAEGPMVQKLVYDVGVNDGEDTAYYLSRGFRVVGIEADPLWAQKLSSRFEEEIKTGRLTLLNVGVGDQEGEADFWVSERTLWSSFDKEMASRDGLSCYPIKVRMTRLGDLFRQYGVPFYCKIDVEGFDRVCINTLTRDEAPKYLSMELDWTKGEDDLRHLASLGYTHFKIVSQVTRTQPLPALMSLACAMPYRVGDAIRRWQRNWLGVTQKDGWSFGPHSAGPFGEETPGGWRDEKSARELARFLKNIEARREAKGFHDWFDIHARSGLADQQSPEPLIVRQPLEPDGRAVCL